MIQLIDEDDVKKKRVRNVKSGDGITLIGSDDLVDESKVSKIDKKEKIVISENAKKNKKYHLLRWKIKGFLIRENIIKRCINWETVLDVFDSELVSKDDLTDTEIKAIFLRHSCELIEHHTKYREIHGVDEYLWMTPSEHRNLHNRLRKEGKCNVSPDELKKISTIAMRRTEKYKEQQLAFHKEEKYRQYYYDYYKKNTIRKTFTNTLVPNVALREDIIYNIVTNTLTVSSMFRNYHGKKLLIIYID